VHSSPHPSTIDGIHAHKQKQKAKKKKERAFPPFHPSSTKGMRDLRLDFPVRKRHEPGKSNLRSAKDKAVRFTSVPNQVSSLELRHPWDTFFVTLIPYAQGVRASKIVCTRHFSKKSSATKFNCLAIQTPQWLSDVDMIAAMLKEVNSDRPWKTPECCMRSKIRWFT